MSWRGADGAHHFTSRGELVLVIVIVGFLAAIAIPMYGRHIERARIQEATDHLSIVVQNAREWAHENPDAEGNPIWPSDVEGDLGLGETQRFTYEIVEGAGRDASRHLLRVEALGRDGGRMRGVRVSVSVEDIGAFRGEAVVSKP
jgi:Tfp pilus assembly protein PilE